MKNGFNDRRLKRGLAIGVAFLILCTPSLSFGWAAGGHMMTAFIAFNRLNPRARAKARELLAIPIDPQEVSRSSKDFVNASHWADDLRPFPEFDPLKPLHFIVKPFSFDGTPLPTDLPTDNIVTALEANVEILKNSTDKNAQAKALRLVIHFVGDIHQPLHCATRYSEELPEGDLGGNKFSIRIPGIDGQLKKSNLHSYWDSGIERFPPTGPNFAPPPLRRIPPAVRMAVAGNPASDPALKLDDPFNFNSWAEESHELAKNVAHKGVWEGTRPNAKYNRKALRVARKRVAWGGYRLAALLNSIWP
jgi:hypothetical protein